MPVCLRVLLGLFSSRTGATLHSNEEIAGPRKIPVTQEWREAIWLVNGDRNKLVRGPEWARPFRARTSLGMQPSSAAVTQARQWLGWEVMQRLLEAVAGPLAGEEQETPHVAGMRLAAINGLCLDVPAAAGNGAEFGCPGDDAGLGPLPRVRAAGLGALPRVRAAGLGLLPRVRAAGLGECGTRVVPGPGRSRLAAGEQSLGWELPLVLSQGDLLGDRDVRSGGQAEG